MPSDTWLKLHTSLLTSAKFCNLPSNDHRWAFVCLLLLAKKGLESAPESLTLGHLFLGKKRWKTVRADLIDAGLLDALGRVNGFEDSQLTPDAIRMRRYRERNEKRNSYGNSYANGDGDSRKQKAEEEKTPLPPKLKTARQASLAASVTAVQIVTLVNERFGTNRSASPTLIRAVEILLRAGHAADDIMLVVRHRLTNEEWFTPAKYGAESLIRRDKFPSMLQVAKDSQPRPITSASVDEGGWEY